MGANASRGRDNETLLDKLFADGPKLSPDLERAMRLVDRGDYFEEKSSRAYMDLAWRSGSLHLSAPSIYVSVLKHLDLSRGQHFLNIGSGSGYLSSVVGLILGFTGVNHGIEVNKDNVAFAYNRLYAFLAESEGPLERDFCLPHFVCGNIFDVVGPTPRASTLVSTTTTTSISVNDESTIEHPTETPRDFEPNGELEEEDGEEPLAEFEDVIEWENLASGSNSRSSNSSNYSSTNSSSVGNSTHDLIIPSSDDQPDVIQWTGDMGTPLQAVISPMSDANSHNGVTELGGTSRHLEALDLDVSASTGINGTAEQSQTAIGWPEYDRIYVGAAIRNKVQLKCILRLLKVNGVLVAPVQDELVKITRVAHHRFIRTNILSVSFAPLINRTRATVNPPPPPGVSTLFTMCCRIVRSRARSRILHLHDGPPVLGRLEEEEEGTDAPVKGSKNESLKKRRRHSTRHETPSNGSPAGTKQTNHEPTENGVNGLNGSAHDVNDPFGINVYMSNSENNSENESIDGARWSMEQTTFNGAMSTSGSSTTNTTNTTTTPSSNSDGSENESDHVGSSHPDASYEIPDEPPSDAVAGRGSMARLFHHLMLRSGMTQPTERGSNAGTEQDPHIATLEVEPVDEHQLHDDSDQDEDQLTLRLGREPRSNRILRFDLNQEGALSSNVSTPSSPPPNSTAAHVQVDIHTISPTQPPVPDNKIHQNGTATADPTRRPSSSSGNSTEATSSNPVDPRPQARSLRREKRQRKERQRRTLCYRPPSYRFREEMPQLLSTDLGLPPVIINRVLGMGFQ